MRKNLGMSKNLGSEWLAADTDIIASVCLGGSISEAQTLALADRLCRSRVSVMAHVNKIRKAAGLRFCQKTKQLVAREIDLTPTRKCACCGSQFIPKTPFITRCWDCKVLHAEMA